MPQPLNKYIDHPYILLTALRGPDSCDANLLVLKTEITARLRALVFNRLECHGYYQDRPFDHVSLEKVQVACHYLHSWIGAGRASKPELACAEHFVTHLLDALRLLKNNPIFTGPQTSEVVALLTETQSLIHRYLGYIGTASFI